MFLKYVFLALLVMRTLKLSAIMMKGFVEKAASNDE